MDAAEKYVVKMGLESLRAAGGVGLKKGALLGQMGLASGNPSDWETLDTVFQMMQERGWIEYHLDPVWHEKRWTLTERGLTALEGM